MVVSKYDHDIRGIQCQRAAAAAVLELLVDANKALNDPQPVSQEMSLFLPNLQMAIKSRQNGVSMAPSRAN